MACLKRPLQLREGNTRLRCRAEPQGLLHAGAEPTIEWHVGIFRENLQTRLRSYQPPAGRSDRAQPNQLMLPGLQRKPSP